MEYYKITQKKKYNYIRPRYLSMSQIWSDRCPVLVEGYVDKYEKNIRFLPLYVQNVFLISNPLKKILTYYQKGGRYRPCAFGSVQHRQIRPYSFMMPAFTDCIHSDTRYMKSGGIEELFLDAEKIGGNKVFGIKDELHMYLIVSEDVLEEVLRGNITEFNWEKVKLRQG